MPALAMSGVAVTVTVYWEETVPGAAVRLRLTDDPSPPADGFGAKVGAIPCGRPATEKEIRPEEPLTRCKTRFATVEPGGDTHTPFRESKLIAKSG